MSNGSGYVEWSVEWKNPKCVPCMCPATYLLYAKPESRWGPDQQKTVDNFGWIKWKDFWSDWEKEVCKKFKRNKKGKQMMREMKKMGIEIP